MGLNGLNFLRFLCFSHKLSVYDSKNGEHNDEEEEFSADEFVQRTLKKLTLIYVSRTLKSKFQNFELPNLDNKSI